MSDAYDIGTPNNFSVIETGYEDCNVIIDTEQDRFLAKMFWKDRKPWEIERYVTIMEKVVKAGVNHPEIVKAPNDRTVYSDSGITLVLMRYAEGKTFLELNRAPNNDELEAVLGQAAKVNKIDHHPKFLNDSWAISNIKPLYERVKQFVESNDLKLLEEVIRQYDQIPIVDLPHCFVHGDFTKANIVKGDDGRIYILDFSVANWYPRIQELAVITANLLYDANDNRSLQDKSDSVAYAYSQLNPLTTTEIKHLPAYALAEISMELLGGLKEKFIKGHDHEETAYWIETGRVGLRKALS